MYVFTRNSTPIPRRVLTYDITEPDDDTFIEHPSLLNLREGGPFAMYEMFCVSLECERRCNITYPMRATQRIPEYHTNGDMFLSLHIIPEYFKI